MKNNNENGCLYIIIGWILLDFIVRICIWGISGAQISFTKLAMMTLCNVVIGVLAFVIVPIIGCFFDRGGKKNLDKNKSINEVGDNKEIGQEVALDGDVTAPQIALSGERMEGEKRSRTNGSKIFGWVIGFSCLTTLGLVFVAYKYIYLGLLRDGYTASQCVGFWINVLLVIPFVFIGVLIAFMGVFWLIRFLRSRMCSLWKKKNHGDTKGSNPIDTID